MRPYTLFLLLPIPALAQFAVTLEPSIPSPAPVGTVVTWTARTSASSSTLRYRFRSQSPGQERRIIRDFGPANTLQWSPVETEGLYTVEVTVRNAATGAEAVAFVPFVLSSNAKDGEPVVRPTSHPLVWLYSAPPCPAGSVWVAFYVNKAGGAIQNAPPKTCDGEHTLNTYIAGLRPETQYVVQQVVYGSDSAEPGPVLTLTSGVPMEGLPVHTAVTPPANPNAQGVFLAATLLSRFVATDLHGNLIWYYPEEMLFLTRPEPGGFFIGINQDFDADQYGQVVRVFDLAGVTVLETNAGRVNEQLAAMGKRPVGGFHHEARFLSNGYLLALASSEQILTGVQGEGAVNVVGDTIVVMNRDLEVVWAWDSFDHLDVRRAATLGDVCSRASCPPLFLGNPGNDWIHGNSVAETPDGGLIFSMRSQDWTIKIDYRNGQGPGTVLWRLGKDGDFTIDSSDPSPWFSHQHDPEFESDGTLTIFDNGNIRFNSDNQAKSRGQVYRLNEERRVAELLLNADLGYYTAALGSAQRLDNGNYFFDVGFLSNGSSISVEVNPQGESTYAIRGSTFEYRTFRMKDVYNSQ